MDLNHKEISNLAVNWLKRVNSQGGHGCKFAVSEMKSGWSGEAPDAIGFRIENALVNTIVVEVKVSRSDFLADRKKPHRSGVEKGLGNWRYYMCPTGLIKPEDLPPKFGLLYVNKKGHIKSIVSPFITTNTTEREKALERMWFDSDRDREMFMMANLLARIGDVEKMHKDYKASKKAEFDALRRLEKASKTNFDYERTINILNRKISSLLNKLNRL